MLQYSSTHRHRYHYLPHLDKDLAVPLTALRSGGVLADTISPPSSAAANHFKPLPAWLQAEMARMEVTVFRGIWPEIHRVWTSVDDNLFIWNYEWDDAGAPEDEGDYRAIRGLGDAIISVAIVVPRLEVFTPYVKYLLVVATSSAIHLYALTFDDDTVHGPMHVRETGFTVPTDGVAITKIVGTSDGRIFCAGRDGCVHEVIYSSGSFASSMDDASSGSTSLVDVALRAGSWVGETLGLPTAAPKRAKKVNHQAPGLIGSLVRTLTRGLFTAGAPAVPLVDIVVDHDRRLLHTLNEEGGISSYYIGRDPAVPECPPGSGLCSQSASTPRPAAAGGGGAAGTAPSLASASASASDAGRPTILTPKATIIDIEAAAHTWWRNAHPATATNPFVPGRAAAQRRAIATGGGGAAGSTAGVAWPLTSLHVIPAHQSRDVHLMAMAASGTRIFISTYSMAKYTGHAPATGIAGDSAGGMSGTIGGPMGGPAFVAEAWKTGAPAEYGVDGFPGGLGSSLTVVFVATPPPAMEYTVYSGSPYECNNTSTGAHRQGFWPVYTEGSVEATTSAAGGAAAAAGGAAGAASSGGRRLVYTAYGDASISILARKPAEGEGAADASGSISGNCVALVHDPLRHGRTTAGEPEYPFVECVQELGVSGMVLAVGEAPSAPTLYRDPVYTASGALLLPDGNTVPELPPAAASALRRGQLTKAIPDQRTAAIVATRAPGSLRGTDVSAGAVPVGAAAAVGFRGFDATGTGIGLPGTGALALPTGGALRSSPYSLPGAKDKDITAADWQAAMVLQEGCNDVRLAARYHHFMRRRLWGEGPGTFAASSSSVSTASPASDYALQHVPEASLHTYVVLTSSAVYKFIRRRPIIDAVAHALRRKNPADEFRGAAPVPAALLPADAWYSHLYAQLPRVTVAANVVALAMGAKDVVALASSGLLNGPGLEPSSDRARAPSLAIGGAGGAASTGAGGDLVASRARALFASPMYGGLPRSNVTDGTVLFGTDVPNRMQFSVRCEGLITYIARTLQPFIGVSLFVQAPAKVRKDEKGAATDLVSALLLPRFSALEMRSVASWARSAASFIATTFPFALHADNDILLIANQLGLGPSLGQPATGTVSSIPLRGGRGTQAQQIAEENERRARHMEMLIVISLHRFLLFVGERASFMAAVADPAYGCLPLLQAFAKGSDPQQSASAVSLGEITANLLPACLENLGSSDASMAAVEGLTSRMLAALEANAPGTVAPAGGAAGGAGTGFGPAIAGLPAAGRLEAQAAAADALQRDPVVALATYLRTECPSLYSEAARELRIAERALSQAASRSDDAAKDADVVARIALAEQAVKKAVTTVSPLELGKRLPQVFDICAKFMALREYAPPVTICALAAAVCAGGPAAVTGRPADADAYPLPPAPATQTFDRRVRQYLSSIASDASQGRVQVTRLRLGCYYIIVHLLNSRRKAVQPGAGYVAAPGLPVAPVDDASDVLATYRDVLGIPDELFHETIYNWAMGASLTFLLTRHTATPFIEPFLVRQKERTDLLCAYYETHGQAGKAARKHAEQARVEPVFVSPGVWTGPTIEERQVRMERAVAAARLARSLQGDLPATPAEVRDWEEANKTMLLQMEVGAALASARDELASSLFAQGIDPATHMRYSQLAERAAEARQGGILTASQMYAYADKSDVHDAALLVLQVGGSTDHARILRHWHALLQATYTRASRATGALGGGGAAVGAVADVGLGGIGDAFRKLVSSVGGMLLGHSEAGAGEEMVLPPTLPLMDIAVWVEGAMFGRPEHARTLGATYRPAWLAVDTLVRDLRLPRSLVAQVYEAAIGFVSHNHTMTDSLRVHLCAAYNAVVQDWLNVVTASGGGRDADTARRNLLRHCAMLLSALPNHVNMLATMATGGAVGDEAQALIARLTAYKNDFWKRSGGVS